MNHQRKALGAGKQPRAFKKNLWRHCTVAGAVAKELVPCWIAGIAAAFVIAHCTHDAHGAHLPSNGRGRVSAGARNTKPIAACAPDHGRFSCLDSKAGHGLPVARLHDYGQGAAFREGAGTTMGVFRTPCPPYARRKANGGSQTFPIGGRAMSHQNHCAFGVFHHPRGTVSAALKGAGARNTTIQTAATPPIWGFVTSTYRAGVPTHPAYMVWGGMGLSARTPARLRTCFEHPAHH